MDSSSVIAAPRTEDGSSNRWYLAYGSNLSSKTFRGRRGIRPLAQANVLVPSLELTFDLPGIPYWEPCFANVRRRQDGGGRALGDEGDITRVPDPIQEANKQQHSQGKLLGVVYLVTPEDFSRIIATEGGGISYEEVDVECWRISEKTDERDKRIIASTLLAPDNRRRSAPMQPSKRYIDIIRAGAREHKMPPSYIAYLDAMPSYHTSGLRQRVGATLFLAMWLPVLLFMFLLQKVFADRKTGRFPRWLGVITQYAMSAMWENYLQVWKRIFGSGEVAASDELNLEQERRAALGDEKQQKHVSLSAHISPLLDVE